ASPALKAVGTPGLVECPGNDDERERRQRRCSRVIDLRLGSTEAGHGPYPQGPAATTTPHTPPQGRRVQRVTQGSGLSWALFQKITSKNAFDLYLIEYMSNVLKQEQDLTDFKVVASTLDASVKIYSMRVDVVHTDAYKVLGGLCKDSVPAKNVDTPEEENSPVPEAVKRVQTKKKHSVKTIEQNLNNINVSEANRRCAVDPMFQKTAASFDECSTAGIFLSSLHTDSCRSELLFDSDIVPLPSSETLVLPSSDPVNVEGLKALLAQCTEKRPICSSLAGFQFTKWDAESHDEVVSALLEKFKKSDQVFDMNAEVDSDLEDHIPPLPDDNFGSDSPRSRVTDKTENTENTNSFGEFCQNKRMAVAPLGGQDVITTCLHLSMKPGEYSYFSPRTLSMWAGPEHWRFRPRHKGADSGKEAKRECAKKAFEIDFDEEIDFSAYFCKTKEPVTLAKSSLELQNTKRTTLPTDFQYDPNRLLQLSLKPGVKVCRQPQRDVLDEEDEIGDYNYDNPSDTCGFCPALQAADSDDDNDPVGFVDQMGDFSLNIHPEDQDAEPSRIVGHVNATVYDELNLIAEPQKVNKIQIQYAKTEKKVDMKVLKRNIWDILTAKQKICLSVCLFAKQNEDEGEENPPVAVDKVAFSSITKELSHRLPKTMAKDLSVAIAFFGLLDLASEKNLMLESTEDLSDVLVKQ
ncbi:CND2 protein, partial [Heliornis fulica]|nr:CND2 protein [Heliornis fulica]